MSAQTYPSPTPITPAPMSELPIGRRRLSRPPRTVVHAGPLVLARDDATMRLERYLDREADRELILIHHGQATLQEIAREAGVNAVRLESVSRESEERAAADMAIALGAEQLEFAIDEPCLRDDSGRPVRELTAYEAKAYAADTRLPTPIRSKLQAGCSALDRGLTQVRIGHPAALDRERATIVFPDPPMDFGAELVDPDDSEPAASVAATNRIREQAASEEPSLPPLDLRVYQPSRRVKRKPRTTCEIGRRTPQPFPDLPEPYATYSIGSRGRSRRRVARRA